MTDARSDFERTLYDRIVDVRELDEYDLAQIADDDPGPAILLRHGRSMIVLIPEPLLDGIAIELMGFDPTGALVSNYVFRLERSTDS